MKISCKHYESVHFIRFLQIQMTPYKLVDVII